MWAEKPHLKISPGRTKTDTMKVKEASVLVRLWLKWLGPVIAGLFTAIFANWTETSGAVLVFYVSILATFVYHQKYSTDGEVVSLVNQYITLGFFFIATLVGLPTLFIHAWLM